MVGRLSGLSVIFSYSEITAGGQTEMSCQVSSPVDSLYHKTITYN